MASQDPSREPHESWDACGSNQRPCCQQILVPIFRPALSLLLFTEKLSRMAA